MIKEFVEKWYERKEELRTKLESLSINDVAEYSNLVKLVVETILNDDMIEYATDKISVIDDGDYQGTQVFIIPENSYQPSVEQYIYTSVYYGSCSGCDTLLSIICFSNYDEKLKEEQVNDIMTLCLHLIQNFKKM